MKLKVGITLVCTSLLMACGPSDNDRLKVISREYRGTILYDTRTGVEYWMSNIHSNVLTVMVDENGKPLIYDRVESGDYSD